MKIRLFTETQEDVFYLTDNPSGKIIGEFFASSEIYHHFCEDGNYMKDEDGRTYKYGTWEMREDQNITLTINSITQIIGVGDPLPPPEVVPGNFLDQYET